jgi:plasmid stabilization system protein ParE
MACQLIWSPSARLDLKELVAYISESRPEAARRFVRKVFDGVAHLAEFPESGRVVPEFDQRDLREVIRRPCRIVYRIKQEAGVVEIVRVWHAARGTPEV